MSAILEAKLLAEAESSKKRTDSLMWNMPDDHFVCIVEWLVAGMSAKVIVQLCRDELKLPPAKVPSISRLYAFWSGFKPFYLVARRREAANNSRALYDEMTASPLNLEQATLDELRTWAYELAQDRACDPKAVKAIMTLIQKDAQLKLDREKLSASQRSKIEAGLEALRVEIEGNSKAMEAWQKMKEALANA